MEGLPLTAHVEQRGLDVRRRLELIARIADAVHHAHLRGVIHRDLKPANILVVDEGAATGTTSTGRPLDGGVGQPKILDFGIARATDADIRTTTLRTEVGQLVGTVPYMSPEQASGDPEALDARSDVYALGVVAYEALTGRLPFEFGGRMVHEAVRIIREETPAPLSTIERSLRGDVETIISKALEKDPARRYQSAAEFAADVRRHLANQPIEARPPSSAYQMRKFARRHRTAVVGAAAVLLVLVAGVIATSVTAIDEARQRRLAERRFDDLREVANVLMFDIQDELADVPGTLPAQERLVEAAQTYLDRLAADAGDDLALLEELATSYGRLGDVQGADGRAHLGRFEQALTNYRTQRRIAESLVAQRPREVEHHVLVARALERIGYVQRAMNRPEEAMETLTEAVEHGARMTALFPDHDGSRRLHARALLKVGDLHRDAGALDEALARYERAHAIRLDVVATNPHTASRRELSVTHGKIGDVLMAREDLIGALEHFEQAIEIREALLAEDPESFNAQRDVSFFTGRVGELMFHLGRLDESRARFERDAELRRELAAAAPQDARARRDLVIADYRLGVVHRALGQVEDAAVEARRAALETSVDSYDRAIDLVRAMERDGVLRPRDAGLEAMFATERDESRAALASLEDETVAAPASGGDP